MTAGATTQTKPAERAAPTVADRPLTAEAVLQLLLLTAAWGANAPALRYSLLYLPPNGSAAIRFMLGIGVVVLIARWHGVSLALPRAAWSPLFRISMLFAAQVALLNYGSALTGASRQALLINSYPLFVPIFAHFFLRGDRITWNKAAGTGLAFLGILFVFGERFWGGVGSITGDGLVLASGFLLAVRMVYTSALVQGIHPFTLLFWQSVLALPVFVALALLFEPLAYTWSAPVVASMLYQGIVVAGICFVGWTAMLQRYSPSRLSVGFFLTPVFGAVSSYVLLQEPITLGLAAGGVVILLGLFVANRTAKSPEPQPTR